MVRDAFVILLQNRTVEPGGLLSITFKSNIFISVKHRRCLIFVIRHISGKKILVEDQLFFLIDVCQQGNIMRSINPLRGLKYVG